MMKSSLKDIAKEAGVSITTVSFVINNKAKEQRISDAIVAKIEKVIKKRNFIPNAFAHGLRTGKSYSIGLIVENIGNYFFSNVAKTIEMAAQANNYSVFFSSTNNDDEKAKELLSKLMNQQVDGLIITPTKGIKEQLKQIKKAKIPFLLFDRFLADLETNYVVVDNFKGAYELTNHLFKKGYTNIGFVTIENGMNQMEERLNGYKAALADHKIKYKQQNILAYHHSFTNNNREFELEKLGHFLQKNKKMDALFLQPIT